LKSLDGISWNKIQINSLEILHNDALESLSSLNNLKQKNLESLEIISNPKLQSLQGLDNIVNVTELTIGFNPNLISLNGLNKLTNVNMFEIRNNEKLESLDGFHNLFIGDLLNIVDNEKLVFVHDLSKQLRYLQTLYINNNPSLTNLTGDDLLIHGLKEVHLTDTPIISWGSLKSIKVLDITITDCDLITKIIPFKRNHKIHIGDLFLGLYNLKCYKEKKRLLNLLHGFCNCKSHIVRGFNYYTCY
jgi:hypothetical protein